MRGRVVGLCAWLLASCGAAGSSEPEPPVPSAPAAEPAAKPQPGPPAGTLPSDLRAPGLGPPPGGGAPLGRAVTTPCGQELVYPPATPIRPTGTVTAERLAGELDAIEGGVNLSLDRAGGVRAAVLEPILHGPQGRRLVGLNLSGHDLGPVGGKALGAAPDLRQLHALSLADTALGQAGLRGLFHGTNMPGIMALDLRNAGLDADALEALAQVDGWRRLAVLDLRGASVSAEAIAARLLDARLVNLQCLVLDAGVTPETRARWAEREVELRP